MPDHAWQPRMILLASPAAAVSPRRKTAFTPAQVQGRAFPDHAESLL